MSKGKYKRKRERARERAKQETTGIPTTKIADASIEAKNSDLPYHQANEKREKNISMAHVKKPDSNGDLWIRVFTGVLTVVACFQWFITYGQLKVMRVDERPWVHLKSPRDQPKSSDEVVAPDDGEIVSGKVIRFPMKLVNTGKSPARNVHGRIFFAVLRADQQVRFDCVDKGDACPNNHMHAGIIFPGTELDAPGIRTRQYGLRDVLWIASEDEARAWQSGQAYMAVYGQVTYDDVDGGQHWSKFCNWRGHGSTLGGRGDTATIQY
jgi:hypothetical protein